MPQKTMWQNFVNGYPFFSLEMEGSTFTGTPSLGDCQTKLEKDLPDHEIAVHQTGI